MADLNDGQSGKMINLDQDSFCSDSAGDMMAVPQHYATIGAENEDPQYKNSKSLAPITEDEEELNRQQTGDVLGLARSSF